jgi:hypothetical protein
MTTVKYEQDFYAWAMQTVQALREGRLSEADLEHVAEELEDMGRSEKRALTNRLAVLLRHLLKWRHQPERHGNSWRYTIEEQRVRVAKLLEDNPSLKHELEGMVSHAYRLAVLRAARETGISKSVFPDTCPFTLEQILDDGFWPEL